MQTLTERTERIMQLLEHTREAVQAAADSPASANTWLDAVLCGEALTDAMLEWKHAPEFPTRRR
jgi:hypothetical protein